MKEMLMRYYHFFDWESGDNTCIQFTVVAILLVALTVAEVYTRVKKHRSLFF